MQKKYEQTSIVSYAHTTNYFIKYKLTNICYYVICVTYI